MKLESIDYIYCVVEKESFTQSWYEFAKGGEIEPQYVDFFIRKDSALDSLIQLEKENPNLEFDVMKTKSENFTKYWTKSPHWSHQ